MLLVVFFLLTVDVLDLFLDGINFTVVLGVQSLGENHHVVPVEELGQIAGITQRVPHALFDVAHLLLSLLIQLLLEGLLEVIVLLPGQNIINVMWHLGVPVASILRNRVLDRFDLAIVIDEVPLLIHGPLALLLGLFEFEQTLG